MELKNFLYKISELRTYFLRGHSNWFAYVISLLNFVTISFYLLIENLTIIPENIRFRHYAIIFVVLYLPLAIIVGYFDMKKGTYKVEQNIARELSPIWNDVFDKFSKIQENQLIILERLKQLEAR